jgi:hypothetical protein
MVLLGGLTLVMAAAALIGLVAAALPYESTFEPVVPIVAAFVALPLAGMLVLAAAIVPRLAADLAQRGLLAALNASAYAFVLSLDLAYDGYYDDGTRFIDRGPVDWGTMVVIAGVAAAATLLGRRFAKAGAAASGLLLWMLVPVAVYLHAGH